MVLDLTFICHTDIHWSIHSLSLINLMSVGNCCVDKVKSWVENWKYQKLIKSFVLESYNTPTDYIVVKALI